MAQSVFWTRAGGSPVAIGHVDQKGYANPQDSDGLRRYRISLILAGSGRSNYETLVTSLQDSLRIRPLVIKETNYNRKYIVPNGSQGILTTDTFTSTTVFPESVDPEVGADGTSANVVVTFVKALL